MPMVALEIYVSIVTHGVKGSVPNAAATHINLAEDHHARRGNTGHGESVKWVIVRLSVAA